MSYDHYRLGFDARLKGDSGLACPYIAGTEEWFDWKEGWTEQDQHLRNRDEALRSIGLRD